MNKNIKFDTIVISGGSLNGVTLMGTIQYIYDNYDMSEVKNYIATSVGAMICYLLCIGYKPVEILVIICTHNLLDRLKDLDFSGVFDNKGAVSFSEIEKEVETMTYTKIGYIPTIRDIKEKFNKNLIITTYNLNKNEPVYIDYETHPDLSCLTALRMTSSIPLLFEKCIYNDEVYIDGAAHDNFPMDKAVTISDKILGVSIPNTNPIILNDTFDMKTFLKILLIPIHSKTIKDINKYSEYKNINIIVLDQKVVTNLYDFSVSNSVLLDMFSNGYKSAHDFFISDDTTDYDSS